MIYKIINKKILNYNNNFSHFNRIKINNKMLFISMAIVNNLSLLKLYFLKMNQSKELLIKIIIKSNYRE